MYTRTIVRERALSLTLKVVTRVESNNKRRSDTMRAHAHTHARAQSDARAGPRSSTRVMLIRHYNTRTYPPIFFCDILGGQGGTYEKERVDAPLCTCRGFATSDPCCFREGFDKERHP